MKICVVVPTAFPAKGYGGPVNSLHRNCIELSKQGNDICVISTCLGQEFKTRHEITFGDSYRATYFPTNKSIKVSFLMMRSVVNTRKNFNVMIVEDVFWLMTIFILILSHLTNWKLVIVPRGVLMNQALISKSYWKKRAFLFIINFCIKLLRRPPTILFTSKFEKKNSFLLENSAYFIIPNRISRLELPKKELEDRSYKNLIYVGRLSPEKQLKTTLEVFLKLKASWPDLKMFFIGPDYGEKEILQKACDEHVLSDIIFLGELNSFELQNHYSKADCLILNSSFENFGNVILEALEFGCPAVTNENNPWSILNDYNAGAQVPDDVDCLSAAVHQVLLNGRDTYQSGINSLLLNFDAETLDAQWRELLK